MVHTRGHSAAVYEKKMKERIINRGIGESN